MGYNDIQKICADDKPTEDKAKMIADFFTSILKIKQCLPYTKLQYATEFFAVDKATHELMILKGLPDNNAVLTHNIAYCFHAIRLVNVVYSRTMEMKTEPISHQNETHMALLDSLWSNMKPNERRSASGHSILSSDWMALGFQGNDPTTDFRSLGLLGLYQLVYFSLHRTQTAHMVLAELSKPGKYYPFAVIGINISQFVMELFAEHRLHRLLFDNYRNIIMACSSVVRQAPSDDNNCLNYCGETVHDVYCLVFEEFYLLWVVRNPADIMSFSDLFNELKASIRSRYPAL